MLPLYKSIKAALPQTFAIISGAIFMLSGFLKAMDSGAFARLLGDYGIPYLEYTAPVIIVAEVLLGFLLITGIKQRIVSTLSVIMLIIFTAGFAYGVLFRDVTDCGCFGDSGILGSTPAAVFIRNGILLAMLIIVAMKHKDTRISEKFPAYAGAALIVAGSLTAFMAGRTFRNIHANRHGATPIEPQAVASTALSEFISVHPRQFLSGIRILLQLSALPQFNRQPQQLCSRSRRGQSHRHCSRNCGAAAGIPAAIPSGIRNRQRPQP